jgi:hypothetical protein
MDDERHGYKLTKCEVLSAPKPTPEELAEDPDHPYPDGFVLFRCIVHCPDQTTRYINVDVASKSELKTKEFWENLWDHIMGEEHGVL